MAALSVTTVVLSLTDGCPGLAFYILEIIVNTSMILEVGIRFVALGKVWFLILIHDNLNVHTFDSNSGSHRSISWI